MQSNLLDPRKAVTAVVADRHQIDRSSTDPGIAIAVTIEKGIIKPGREHIFTILLLL